MNIGYFTSFTVFLALNDASFCNRWLPSLSRPGMGAPCPPVFRTTRPLSWLPATLVLRGVGLSGSQAAARGRSGLLACHQPCASGRAGSCQRSPGSQPPLPHPAGVLSLSGYLRFWGCAYLAITAGVALLTRERPAGGSASSVHGAENGWAQGRSKAAAGGAPATPGSAVRRSARLAAAASPAPASPAPCPLRDDGSGASLASDGDEDEVLPLREAYLQLWRVVRLPAVQASLM